MPSFDAVADFPIDVETVELRRHESETSSGFTRVTTEFVLRGAEAVGRGEDVTYETDDHDALRAADPEFLSDLRGERTLGELAAHLDDRDLFPEPPERAVDRNYRRWAVESAALDLALRRAETTLGAVLGREYDPVRFVASTRLGDPPTVDRVDALRDHVPEIGLKLDPTPDWSDDLIAALGDRGGVEILDLKGRYEGTTVDGTVDSGFYRRIVDGFPDAVIEDPALTDDTRAVFDGAEGRVAWDAPITGVDDLEALPWTPRWLNVKPSRFGSLASLLDALTWAGDRGVRCYGGGQFELSVGRGGLHELASLFYPDGPNDIAPAPYNRRELPDSLPTSPIDPPADHVGFGWRG